MLRFGICVCLLAGLAAEQAVKPYGRIFKDGKLACLGALVSNTYIATTASCVYKIQPSKLEVKVGDRQDGQTAKKVRVHPYYSPKSNDYNIALVQLMNSTSGVKNLELQDKTPRPNETLQVYPEEKNATLVEAKTCQKELGNSFRLSGKMLCAAVPSGVQQGSPLFVPSKGNKLVASNDNTTSKLVGIAFYEGRGNSPKVFTKIVNSEIYSFLKDYIER